MIYALVEAASVGVALLLWCLGTDLIIALSGQGKAGSGPVFATMGATNALLPVMLVCAFGLSLERRTKTILGVMCGAVAVNAASPRNRPTQTAFTDPFSDCAMLPARIGSENNRRLRPIGPEVRSSGALAME